MNKAFKKSLVVAAVVGAVTSSLPGTASAYTYAMSHINIQNLQFSASSPAQVTGFSFDLTNTATVGGIPGDVQTASCGGLPGPGFNDCGFAPVLDALAAEVPLGARGGQNNFTFVGPSNLLTYASSDSIITTAELVTGTPTSVQGIAEANLSGGGNALANTEIQSNTTVSFNVLTSNSFDFTFEADPDMRAAIDSALPGTYTAQSNMNTSISISANNLDITISFNPQGNAANSCSVSGADSATVTCTELNDTQDLNLNPSTGTNPSDIIHSFENADLFTAFGIRVAGLPLETYSVALNTQESVSIRAVVPEPGSIALIGLGLLGMGVALRRRNRSV